MEISDELKEKIERVFINNKPLIKDLLSLDPDAIAKIGVIAQSGISPKKVIEAHKKNDMELIYKIAIKKVEAEEIYNELLHIFIAKNTSQEYRGREVEER